MLKMENQVRVRALPLATPFDEPAVEIGGNGDKGRRSFGKHVHYFFTLVVTSSASLFIDCPSRPSYMLYKSLKPILTNDVASVPLMDLFSEMSVLDDK